MSIPFSTWGRSIGINVASTVSITDNVTPVDTTKTFYAGRAVTIDPVSKKLVPVASNVKPLGLCRFNKNVYIDETLGAYGMYGSGLGSTLILGVAEVSHNYFTLADGTEVTVKNYVDALKTAAPLSPVYVSLDGDENDGLLTPVVTSGVNDNTFIGYLLVAPSDAMPIAKILVIK